MDSGKRLSLNQTLQIQSEILNKEIDSKILEAFSIQFGWEEHLSPLDGTGRQALGTGPPGWTDAAELLCRCCRFIIVAVVVIILIKSNSVVVWWYWEVQGQLLVGLSLVLVWLYTAYLWECMEPRV